MARKDNPSLPESTNRSARRSKRSNALQMCILKASGILQAKTNQAIHPDVRGPDQRVRQPLRPRAENRKAGEEQRPRIGVNRIVERRPKAHCRHIPHHREIRHQEQQHEARPSTSDVAIKKYAEDECGRSLNSQNHAWFGRHTQMLSWAEFSGATLPLRWR